MFQQVEETKDKNAKGSDAGADFETAISACGFGKFNYLLLLAIAPATWTGMFDTGLMSYVSPAAQCDLVLSLGNKGMLNAIMFMGIISSAFIWGFIADNFGRRKIMIYGYITGGILNLCCALYANYTFILVLKFWTGFIGCGPFAVLRPYVSEFHNAKYRPTIILVTGILYAIGNLALPCLAWWILPKNFKVHFCDSYELYSWQIFILVCTFPFFLAAACLFLMPESPKYLIATGRNEEALKIFQKIYSMNNGQSKDKYPIKQLIKELDIVCEIKVQNDNFICQDEKRNKITEAIQDTWTNIRPLFVPPYLTKMVLVYFINMGVLLGSNTLRLWLPQFFKSMDEYLQLFGREGSVCETLDYVAHMNLNSTMLLRSKDENTCIVDVTNNQVYINSIIVSVTTIIGYLLAGSLINTCGKKNLTVWMLMIAGICGLSIRWSPNSEVTVALSSVSASFANIISSAIDSIVIETFPMNLRTMISSLTMMSGRIGSIIGNLLFPILLPIGCLAPFLLIGGTMIACAVLVIVLSLIAKT